MGLMAGESDRKPSIGIEGSRPFDHPPHHRGESAADLLGADTLGQLLAKTDVAQQVKGSESVGDRSPNHRECSFWADHSFLDCSVSSCTLEHLRLEGTPHRRL